MDFSSNVEEKGLIKVSIRYPFAEGKTFNMDYCETSMVAGYLGSNLVASGIPNTPLPFMDIYM